MSSFQSVITFSPKQEVIDKPKAESRKKAREGALLAGQEEAAKVEAEKTASSLAAKEEKKKRLLGVQRNVTTFTSPLGITGQAEAVRKVLTG